MKTYIYTFALSFALAVATLGPKAASAQRSNISSITGSGSVHMRNPQRPVHNARHNVRHNPHRRPGVTHNSNFRHNQNRANRQRVWVDGRWNRGPRGRQWVTGHWEFRVVNTWGRGCRPAPVVHHPVVANRFDVMYHQVASRSFENGRLNTALRIVNSNWLTSAQVRSLMGLMSFENSRLQLAQAAYGNTVDKQNYFIVNDMFSFDSSVGQLEQFIYGW